MLIKNGMIHDMVQREPYKADLLIEDGKIKAIGTDLPEEGDAYNPDGTIPMGARNNTLYRFAVRIMIRFGDS